MTGTTDARAEALGLVESYIDDAVEGLVSNSRAIEAHPADREAGIRVRKHLIELDRLYAVRRGLRDA